MIQANELGKRLKDWHWTIATAESCTAGGIGAAIASVDGASSYFKGGVISYATEVKIDVLGVNPDIIQTHGVVSAQTVVAMNRGVRKLLGTDMAISISGYAGSSGGDEFAANGTIWICVGSDLFHETTQCIMVHGNRKDNLQQAIETALQMAVDYLDSNEKECKITRG